MMSFYFRLCRVSNLYHESKCGNTDYSHTHIFTKEREMVLFVYFSIFYFKSGCFTIQFEGVYFAGVKILMKSTLLTRLSGTGIVSHYTHRIFSVFLKLFCSSLCHLKSSWILFMKARFLRLILILHHIAFSGCNLFSQVLIFKLLKHPQSFHFHHEYVWKRDIICCLAWCKKKFPEMTFQEIFITITHWGRVKALSHTFYYTSRKQSSNNKEQAPFKMCKKQIWWQTIVYKNLLLYR